MSGQAVSGQGGAWPGVSAQGGVCPGGCLPRGVCPGGLSARHTSPVNRMTNACENITFTGR